MRDPEFRRLMDSAGVDSVRLAEELALATNGYEPRMIGEGSELWEDCSEDSRCDCWISREEAIRRIKIRAGQGTGAPVPENWRGSL